MSEQPTETDVVDPAIEKIHEQERRDRIVRHRAELFIEISKHPAWQELVDEMERKRDRMRANVAYKYFEAGLEVDQRQLDYDRGFADGTRYMASAVAAAQNTLDKLDREAEERAAQTVTEPENETGGWD